MRPCPPVPGDLILFFPQISAQGSKPVYFLLYNIELAPSLHPKNNCCFHSRDNRTALICPEADGKPKAPASWNPRSECRLLLDRLNVFTKHKIAAKRVEQGKERKNTLENMLEQHPTIYFSKAKKRREPGEE